MSAGAVLLREVSRRVRESPYVGLTHFTEEDALFFFGREAERRIIVANLMASRLTLVYGPSGVGKSSLLRAGVVRDVRTAAESAVEAGRIPASIGVVFSSWRDEPLFALGELLAKKMGELLGDLAPDPVPPMRSLDELLELWTTRLDERARELEEKTGIRQPEHVELLLVLDQFEEYFVYHPGEEGMGTFAGEFPRAVNRRGLRANFLVSIREDAYTLLDRFEDEIPNLFGNNIRVEHLDRDAAEQAIRGPVDRYTELWGSDGGPSEVEDDLVDAVIEQVKTGTLAFGHAGAGTVASADEADLRVETPFLQLVMERLWAEEVTRRSGALRLTTLESLGGAQKIVHEHLGRAVEALDDDARELAASVFGRLVTPSGSKIAYLPSDLAALEKVPLQELSEVLAELARLRILRAVAPPPGETEPRYEIFHDVLAPAILQWRTAHAFEHEQLEAARLASTRAKEARRRRRVRLLFVFSGVSVLLVFAAAALTAWALNQRNDAVHARSAAERSARLAGSQRLAANAFSQLAADPELAALLAERALRIEPTAQAADALRAALSQPYYVRSVVATSPRPIADATFGADGALVATAGIDGRVRLSSTATGGPLRTLSARPRTTLGSVALSPNGKYVAAAGADRRAHVWAVANGRPLGPFALFGRPRCVEAAAAVAVPVGPPAPVAPAAAAAPAVPAAPVAVGPAGPAAAVPAGAPVVCGATEVAFSPDSTRLVAAGADGSAAIWNVASGRRVAVLDEPASYVYDVSFNRDGTRVATATGDHFARIWDAHSGVLVARLGGHSNVVNGVSFSPDGRLVVTASWDGTARVWDAESGRSLHVLRGHTGRVYTAAFSSDGRRIVTASADRTARVWTSTGRALAVLRGHTGAVNAARFDPRATLVVTASTDDTARIWRTDGELIATLRGHKSSVRTARFSPDGKLLLTASLDGTARLWQAAPTPATIVLRARPSLPINSTDFNPRGTRMVAFGGFERGKVVTWDLRTRRTTGEFSSGAYSSPQFAADGRSVVTVHGGKAELWRDGTRIRGFPARGRAYDAELSGDRTRVAVTSLRTVAVDDVATGRLVSVLRPRGVLVQDPIERAVPSFDGRLVVLSFRGRSEVWQVSPPHKLAGAGGIAAGGSSDEVFSRDGSVFLTVDGAASVWKTQTGRRVASVQVADLRVARLTSSGRFLLTSSFGGAPQIWDARTGESVAALAPSGATTTAHFSPDGKLVVTGTEEGATQVWEASTGQLVSTYRGSSLVVRTIFSPSGRQVATAMANGSIRIWTCELCGSWKDLLRIAHDRVRRKLTAAESARYLTG